MTAKVGTRICGQPGCQEPVTLNIEAVVLGYHRVVARGGACLAHVGAVMDRMDDPTQEVRWYVSREGVRLASSAKCGTHDT